MKRVIPGGSARYDNPWGLLLGGSGFQRGRGKELRGGSQDHQWLFAPTVRYDIEKQGPIPKTPSTEWTSPSFVVRRDLVVLLLAIAGGGVDAVIILGFGVLTAAQTGNTILLATALAQGRLTNGFHAAISIVGYVVGSGVGESVLVARSVPADRFTPVRWTLAIESIFLGCLLISWRLVGPDPSVGVSAVLVALAALAMGIQSAAVLRLHAGPTTTYITGSLTTFATNAIGRLRPNVLAAPLAPAEDRAHRGFLSSAGPWFYAITWLVYAGGAVAVALIFLRIGAAALLLPIVSLLGAMLLDRRS